MIYRKVRIGDFPKSVRDALMRWDMDEVEIDEKKLTQPQIDMFTKFMRQKGYEP